MLKRVPNIFFLFEQKLCFVQILYNLEPFIANVLVRCQFDVLWQILVDMFSQLQFPAVQLIKDNKVRCILVCDFNIACNDNKDKNVES